MSSETDLWKECQDEIKELQKTTMQNAANIAILTGKVESVLQSNNQTLTLIKWIITPLLGIVGALVGIKIILPAA